MIKIVHIARPISGVGVYIDLLVRHIDDKRIENVLICNMSENNIDVLDKSNNKIQYYHTNLIREIKIINDIKCLLKIVSLLKKIKPDIIHCHSAKAGFLGRIAGAYLQIPTFYTPHAYSYLNTEGRFKEKMFKYIEKMFCFLPSKTIACSKSEYDRTIKGLNISKNKVYLWNNSIEDNIKLGNTEFIKELPEKFICSIGRPSYQKNTEMLVETILDVKKTIKHVHLVILGVGFYSPSLEKIKKMIINNNLENNITLIPWIERPKVMTILQKSQIYISSSRYEGLSYCVIEALALSKPCVVTRVDGNKDLIIDNFNGFLVEEDDHKTMVKKIIKIMQNNDLLHKMSINARKEYEKKYNIKNNINKIEEIYFSAINQTTKL